MEIIESNDKLYIKKRVIKKDNFENLNEVQKYRDFIHADHVLNYQDSYIFCNRIDDVEFEEIKNENGDLV